MQKNRKRIFTWILLFTVSIQVFWWDGISVSAEPAAIEAPSAVLLESSTGKVIFEQNARERRSPASITKIMTAMLALQSGKLNDTVTITQDNVTLEDGSQVCGFVAGDQVTLDQLLHCLLVYSGNDAASAIAEYVGADLILNGDPEEYLKNVTGSHGLED